ncbi:MAG: alpha/beta hydrolase, partial [Dehalococcoidia bacterium]
SEGWYRQGEEARSGRVGQRVVKPEHLDSFIASARAVAGLREHPLTPRLKHITCPALVVAGGQDAVTRGAGGSVIMARNLPHSRLEIFQDAGHAIYSQRREEFRALVLDFCKEHRIIAA